MERLTATQAAARLGIRTETLYAYVSRGLLSRDRTAQGSRFDPLEVERFARTRRRRPPVPGALVRAAGSDGHPLGVIETDITLVEDGELWFRGVWATALAGLDEGASLREGRFDAVVRWLFDREPRPREDASVLRRYPRGTALSRAAESGDGVPAFTRLLTAVATMAAEDPQRFDLAPDSVAAVTERLLAGLVDSFPLRGEEADEAASLARRLWVRLTAVPPTPDRVAVLDAALVLLIDHDMAASTLAARAAASARAHPYAVVAAGLGALDSALHGAASAACHLLLREVADGRPVADAVAAASRRAAGGVPGFGAALHPDVDPRARDLLQAARSAAADDRTASAAVDAADGIVAYVHARTGASPSVDLALATMSLAWGMPEEAGEVVFAVARAAGWCAHAVDEYARPPLRLRPVGRYVGPDPGVAQLRGRPDR